MLKTIAKALMTAVFTETMLLFFCSTVNVNAADDLDFIQDYDILVQNVRQDGTMDIVYSITWEVLSDKNGSEPVEWVEVGIPNQHVDQVRALTDNIKTAEYSNHNGGDYVRIDFNEAHYVGEVFTFEFSIHQSYMYLIQGNTLLYQFRAGWFDEIKVGRMQIEWLADDRVKETDSNEQTDQYYIWSYSDLEKGESVTATVKYDSSTFYVDENQQYVERSMPGSDSGEEIAIVIVTILVIIVVAAIAIVLLDDGYGGGGGGSFVSYRSGGGGCVHSSCACACACACAGGGRAGCSVKEFYQNNPEEAVVDVNEFTKAAQSLSKDKKPNL